MSVIKSFRLRCDCCGDQFQWSFDLVAGMRGNTGGAGTVACRQEAKEAGWIKSRTSSGKPVDLCPACVNEKLEFAWFEKRRSS